MIKRSVNPCGKRDTRPLQWNLDRQVDATTLEVTVLRAPGPSRISTCVGSAKPIIITANTTTTKTYMSASSVNTRMPVGNSSASWARSYCNLYNEYAGLGFAPPLEAEGLDLCRLIVGEGAESTRTREASLMIFLKYWLRGPILLLILDDSCDGSACRSMSHFFSFTRVTGNSAALAQISGRYANSIWRFPSACPRSLGSLQYWKCNEAA